MLLYLPQQVYSNRLLVNHLWPSISLLPPKNQNQFSKVKLYSLKKNILNFNKNIWICYFVNFWLAIRSDVILGVWYLVFTWHMAMMTSTFILFYYYVIYNSKTEFERSAYTMVEYKWTQVGHVTETGCWRLYLRSEMHGHFSLSMW